MTGSLTLADYGERRLISEILGRRYAHVIGFGDDSARLPHYGIGSGDALLVTTDPCPEPAAGLAGFHDEYYRGWLLATINLSDLAASGARPLGLVTSLILPSATRVTEFERLLDGIDGCCAHVGTAVVGGNLKEGLKIETTATAIGVCAGGPPMSRTGGRRGDLVALVGDVGLFWAGLTATRRGVSLPTEHREALLRNLLTPVPKIAAGEALRASRLVTSCLDNSDGLYPSLEALHAANGFGVELDFKTVLWHPAVDWAASVMEIDPVRFALGWGDWQLIVTFDPSSERLINDALAPTGLQAVVIGVVTEEQGTAIRHLGGYGPLAHIDSQRFAADSWFSAGLKAYENTLLLEPFIMPA